MTVQNYRELIVWQKAVDLVVDVYQKTKGFPRDEQFALTGQLRRAVVSIPSNIAEGAGRETTKEFRRFLAIAKGSLQEAETQLIIAHRLHYLDEAEQRHLLNRCAEVGRLLNGLSKALKRKLTTNH